MYPTYSPMHFWINDQLAQRDWIAHGLQRLEWAHDLPKRIFPPRSRHSFPQSRLLWSDTRSVFEVYQNWQWRSECQPALFLGRELPALMRESRTVLGKYLNAEADDLVYIPNATHRINIIARSLALKPGDEVLTTDHEYGARDYTWDFNCGRTGARYIHQSIPLPVHTEVEIVEQFWEGVTPQTKVIYFSQITSSTALRLPVDKICQRARQLGILTIIDAPTRPSRSQSA